MELQQQLGAVATAAARAPSSSSFAIVAAAAATETQLSLIVYNSVTHIKLTKMREERERIKKN